MSLNAYLAQPPLGAPSASMTELMALQNTSGWAVDPNTGEHISIWSNPSSVHWGPGTSANPRMIYTSPLVHTVRLGGLEPGTRYSYCVGVDFECL